MAKEIPKYGNQDVIQFVGVKDLSIEEQTAVSEITTQEFEKIKRHLKNDISLVVHVKYYKKEGGKNKYSLHIRVIAPTEVIESCKSHDWDLVRAVRKSFEDIMHQIEHKSRLHIPTQKFGKRTREQNLDD